MLSRISLQAVRCCYQGTYLKTMLIDTETIAYDAVPLRLNYGLDTDLVNQHFMIVHH